MITKEYATTDTNMWMTLLMTMRMNINDCGNGSQGWKTKGAFFNPWLWGRTMSVSGGWGRSGISGSAVDSAVVVVLRGGGGVFV